MLGETGAVHTVPLRNDSLKLAPGLSLDAAPRLYLCQFSSVINYNPKYNGLAKRYGSF